jgi:hypothetical protein
MLKPKISASGARNSHLLLIKHPQIKNDLFLTLSQVHHLCNL